MALIFGDRSSTDVVEVTLPALSASCTFLIWWYATAAFVNSNRMWGHSDNATYDYSIFMGVNGDIGFNLGDGDALTNDAQLTTNKWWFTACRGNGIGAAPTVYRGDLSTAAVEHTSYLFSDPVSTILDDSALAWGIGNHITPGPTIGALGFGGRIAVVARFKRSMTLADIRRWQFRPFVDADTELYAALHPVGVPDLSGHNRNGTIVGTTAGGHVPLGPPFGFDESGHDLAINQYARPDADITVGGWLNRQGATPLYPNIDEVTENDADWIGSSRSPSSADVSEVNLSDINP